MSKKPNTRRSADSSAEATRALLKHERFVGTVYEPVRYDTGIEEAVHANGNALFMTSIGLLDYDRPDITNIITEPRPEDAAAFAHKAVDLVTHLAAFLLPLDFLASADAKTLFAGLPLARVYVLGMRLACRKGPMAWYVFEKGRLDAPIIRWI